MTGNDRKHGTEAHADPSWAAAYLDVVTRQTRLLEALDALSREQGPLIEAEDPEPLLTLLSKRAEIVRELEDLDERSRPLRTRFEERAAGVPAPERDRLRFQVDRVSALAQCVLRRDARDQERAAARRKAAALALTEMNGAERANGAYGKPAPQPPRFQDTEA
ncbi:MAG TPA: hypothetical protein VD971_08570 [Phycisphaerales bacterium]|nr:hypothetical protein [Phycisphaerales bacterium]